MNKPGRPKGTTKPPADHKSISIRIPLAMYDKVAIAARGEGRQVSGYVRRIIQEKLETK